jgi:hypothetical protein
MTGIGTYYRPFLVATIFVIGILVLSRCVTKEKKTVADVTSWKKYAGDNTCSGCHKDIYEKHLQTAHHLTSMPALKKNISGSFDSDSNSYYFNSRISVVMEEKNDSMYQVAYKDGAEIRRGRLDIVFGSGTKGQSYASWSGKFLFQLPITYFTPAKQWANSPGFPGRAIFNRPITSRCLECHTTDASVIKENQNNQPDEFEHNKIIFGISCEKCHGPAADHVDFYKINPSDTTGKFIVNPAKFSRQQNLDLCALCHGGRRNKTKPSFTFKAGDYLSDFFIQDTISTIAAGIDVHGNQFGLLANSKCFNMSQMTCGSCHNIHENEKGRIDLFLQRCMSCHSSGHGKICKIENQVPSLKQNCIDCHMPKEPSRSVAVFLQGNDVPTPALMRTHLIKVYLNETRKVLSKNSQVKNDSK